MAQKRYSEEELAEIGCDLVRSLKPKGLLVWELREVLAHAAKALDYIPYGERPEDEEE